MLLDPILAPIVVKPLLEVAHVAHRLRLSKRAVWRLIEKGELIAFRVAGRWRIEEDDLHAYTTTQRAKAIAQKQAEKTAPSVTREGPRRYEPARALEQVGTR